MPVPHRSHDSPVPIRHDSPPIRHDSPAPLRPRVATDRDKATQKFAAAKLVSSMPHEAANKPAAQFMADAPSSTRDPARESAKDPGSMKLKPMTPLERESREAQDRQDKAMFSSLPIVDARVANSDHAARVTLELPKIRSTDEIDRAAGRTERPDPNDVQALIAESEARVMAKLAEVEDSINDLRSTLVHLVEQVRRVSTAPPESDARVIRIVRDALEQVEQKKAALKK